MNCCNKKLELKKGRSHGIGMVYYQCPKCERGGKGITVQDAEKAFKEYFKKSGESIPITKELQPVPKNKDLSRWAILNMPALLNQSAQFIDKPATQRMIEKNIRYISNLSGYAWDKVWNSPEGQESISHALAEALYHAATLPEMGSIVPFGKTAEFIPSVECFKFALETGKNAPFTDINIVLIHENDQSTIEQDKGNFNLKLKYGIPRGEIIALCVYATRTDTGNVIGEIYDVDRLMEKAERHSAAYRNFLIDKADFTRMKIEGKLKKDTSSREYYIKEIKKKDGGIWKKEIYEDEITNPYEGPDRPEMLRKSAGKTFFRPYMKTRNAAAMAGEWESEYKVNGDIDIDQAADNVLKNATGQFKNTPNQYNDYRIKDGEIIPDEKDNKKDPPKKNNKSEAKTNEEKIDL